MGQSVHLTTRDLIEWLQLSLSSMRNYHVPRALEAVDVMLHMVGWGERAQQNPRPPGCGRVGRPQAQGDRWIGTMVGCFAHQSGRSIFSAASDRQPRQDGNVVRCQQP